MITNAVAAPKILVGVVIEHAPAETAKNVRFTVQVIEHSRMPKGMIQSVCFIVKHFSRKHVPVVLAHEIRRVPAGCYTVFLFNAGIVSGMRKVIVCVHIFKQLASLDVPDTAGGAVRVKPASECVGSRIEIMIVG